MKFKQWEATTTAVEWRAGVGTYARCWVALGGDGSAIPLPAWGKAAPNRCVPKVVENPTGANHRPHVVFTTLTEDKSGEEALRFVEYVHRVGAQVVVADYPRGAEVRAAWKLLRKRGFNWTVEDVVATAFGDSIARRRQVFVAWKSSGNDGDWHGLQVNRAELPG